MYKFIVLMTLCCGLLQHGTCQTEEGDSCVSPSGSGTCKKVTECPQAGEDLKNGVKPQLCGFIGRTAIVCCRSLPASKPTAKPVTSHVDYDDDYDNNNGGSECGPVPSNGTTVKKTGRKAWDQCIDYLEYVFPCESPNTLTVRNDKVRFYKCGHEVTGLVVGGQDTADREFPHMALLGFGPSARTANWGCGATVVSKNYVMTAGHCTFARDFGNVTLIRVGTVKKSSPIDMSRIYRVAQIIQHPEYNPPSNYNDLALLKTTTPIIFDARVYPACLHTGDSVDDHKMLATGWGLLNYQGSSANTLQKVSLEKFTTEECKEFIVPDRKQKQGLRPESQLCAGHHTEARDTCQGDSGGPLQIYNLNVKCMYTVMGVTSFGRGCGIVGVPGVYTRVSHFLPWIESIVWP